MNTSRFPGLAGRVLTAWAVICALLLGAGRANAAYSCSSSPKSWSAPNGALVLSRSPGLVKDIVSTLGGSYTHSMISHGATGWVTHAAMRMPATESECTRPVSSSDLRALYPGWSQVKQSAIYTFLYKDPNGNAPELIRSYYQYYAGATDYGGTQAAEVRTADWLWYQAPYESVAGTTYHDSATCVLGYSGYVCPDGHNTYCGNFRQKPTPTCVIDTVSDPFYLLKLPYGSNPTTTYGLYQYMDIQGLNSASASNPAYPYGNGVVCSTAAALAVSASGSGQVPAKQYSSALTNVALSTMWSGIRNTCMAQTSWLKTWVFCDDDLAGVCRRAANQATNCFATNDGSCATPDDHWSANTRGANTISPDQLQEGSGSPWAHVASQTVTWNGENVYACWN